MDGNVSKGGSFESLKLISALFCVGSYNKKGIRFFFQFSPDPNKSKLENFAYLQNQQLLPKNSL